jgi:AraC-like DNA-binding protein
MKSVLYALLFMCVSCLQCAAQVSSNAKKPASIDEFTVLDESDPDRYFDVIRAVRKGLQGFRPFVGHDGSWNVRMNSVSEGRSTLMAMETDGYTFSGESGTIYVATPMRGHFSVASGRWKAEVGPGRSLVHFNHLGEVSCRNYYHYAFACAADDMQTTLADFDGSDFDDFIQNIEGNFELCDFKSYHENLRYLFQLLETSQDQLLKTRVFLKNHLEILRYSLVESAKTTRPKTIGPHDKILKSAVDFIEDNLRNEHLSLAEIARSAGCGVRLLQMIFKRERGMTILKYINSRRLDLARKMLEDFDRPMTVTDVAYACGFSHLSLFARQYAQTYHELPSQTLGYRRHAARPRSEAES